MCDNANTKMKYGAGIKTVKAYMIGLLLSLLFTFASFWIVTDHRLSQETLFILLSIFAIAQLIAQVVYFLRFNMSPDGQWSTTPFLFTILIVLVLVFGSLWIMFNLNYYMVN